MAEVADVIDVAISPRSLFARAGRYPRTAAVDPGENRLTEAFAAVLEHLPALARAVTAACFGFSDLAENGTDWAVHVRTQVSTPSGGFVDLALSFVPWQVEGDAGPRNQAVWVEVKHGAAIDPLQLTSYLGDIGSEAAFVRLVLLTPRSYGVDPLTPPAVLHRYWQDIGAFIRTWRRANARRLSPTAAFLIDQFIQYLYEEGLMDEERLTAAHAFALSAEPGAHNAVAQMCSVIESRLKETHGPASDSKGPAGGSTLGVGFWSNRKNLTSGNDAWRGSWLEWGLKDDAAREQPRRGVAFYAGLTILQTRNSPLTVTENQPWRASLEAKGFEYVSDYYWRFFRYFYPEQVLSFQTLKEQGECVAAWIGETFDLLLGSPPPT